jgi:RNA polymerase sigma-32 factor
VATAKRAPKAKKTVGSRAKSAPTASGPAAEPAAAVLGAKSVDGATDPLRDPSTSASPEVVHPKKRAPVAKAKKAPSARARKRPSDDESDEAREADGDDEEREDDDEESGDDDRGDERETAAEPEGDGDVVEVVGELVDDDRHEEARRPSTVPGRNDAALSRSDPLQAYYREIQRHPLLTPDEEKTLTTEFATTQDPLVAHRLVTANLRLVVKLAYEYRRAYKNIMDLIQEGNIGLMQAVARYDPYRGVKLSSYAAWWIRAYILRFILNNWRLVKLGTTQAQRKLFFNLNKEKAKLSAMGIEPTASEIAKRLSVDEKEVIDMDRRLASGEASLDAPVGDTDGRSVSRLELLPSGTSGPDTALEVREIGDLVRDRLARFRETLKGKDVLIFDKRMVAEDPLTLQELGDEFGISRERVRQLEARLTMKLRQYLKDELGDSVGPS